jgi:tetratricopeptide (TPR) repeat protein
MKRTLLRAGLVASLMLGAAAIASPAAHAATKQPPMTPSVNKALSEAQKLYGKQDFQGALAEIQKAQQVSDPTPYDKLMTNRFMMQVQIALKDLNAADVAAEAAADTDPANIPDDQKDAVYKPALQLALNSKHYDKALKYAQALEALNQPLDANFQSLVMQAHYFGGDTEGAKTLAQKHIDAAKAAGQKPNRNDYDVIMSAQVKAKDEAGAEATLEQLVADYNDPDDWKQIISVSYGQKGIRDIDALYLGRLMFLVEPTPPANDASIVGGVASKMGFYGDAMKAQQAGGTGFPSPDANAQKDKASIQQQIAAGAKQNGTYNIKLAEALYGYGMYPEAEAAAHQAESKGGVADPTEIPMVLGMAQAAQGKYQDALAQFAKVQGGSPATPRIVRLWTYFVKSKMAPATAAAAAPAQ